MTRDHAQLAAAKWFDTTVRAVSARVRITTDVEGWPVVPCRYGQIEWAGDRRAVAIYTTAARLYRALLAIPGVRRHQTGDSEIRVLLAVDKRDFAAGFRAAAALMRARTRQTMTPARQVALGLGRRFQPKGRLAMSERPPRLDGFDQGIQVAHIRADERHQQFAVGGPDAT